jgi:hypothetical protein
MPRIVEDSDLANGAAAQDLKLASMSHAELYMKRAYSKSKAEQDRLAPYEHRAFAREFARESPGKAAVSLPFAIPAYTAAKALGLQRTRSGASLEEMKQGFKGLAEGLFKRGKR